MNVQGVGAVCPNVPLGIIPKRALAKKLINNEEFDFN
jgi:hypothetical protein